MSKNLRRDPRSQVVSKQYLLGPATGIGPVYDQSQIFKIVKCIYKCLIVDWYQTSK